MHTTNIPCEICQEENYESGFVEIPILGTYVWMFNSLAPVWKWCIKNLKQELVQRLIISHDECKKIHYLLHISTHLILHDWSLYVWVQFCTKIETFFFMEDILRHCWKSCPKSCMWKDGRNTWWWWWWCCLLSSWTCRWSFFVSSVAFSYFLKIITNGLSLIRYWCSSNTCMEFSGLVWMPSSKLFYNSEFEYRHLDDLVK